MYQPKLARFTSRDPMPANGVTVLSPVPDMRKHWNPANEPYVYVGNNPANFVDPSGLQPEVGTECNTLPAIPEICLNSKAKTTEFSVCARPLRTAPIGCHDYVKISCGILPGETFSFGAFKGPVCDKCRDKCMDSQLRVLFLTFTEGVGNPDFPQPEDPPGSHVCNHYTVNRPPKEVMDCLREVARRIRDCCIPYEAGAIGDPTKGCNSNCAAGWMSSLCFTPLQGGGKIELPKERPNLCVGFDKKPPDCISNPAGDM